MTEIEECRRILKENPFAVYLGIELLKVEEGLVYARIDNREMLHNIYGDMHGGAIYSIADNQYLKAVRGVEEIFCEARVIKAGKTISSVHVDIRDGAGNLYNTAEFTYFNLRPKEDN